MAERGGVVDEIDRLDFIVSRNVYNFCADRWILVADVGNRVGRFRCYFMDVVVEKGEKG